MKSICGVNCLECSFYGKCKGCEQTCGRPFGGMCVAAEYIKVGGMENFNEFKKTLIEEINNLGIVGMPKIDNLFSLVGSFVNLEYPMPNGEKVKLLDDKRIYLGNQVSDMFNGDKCFGIVADTGFILIAEYGENGSDCELVLYKRR